MANTQLVQYPAGQTRNVIFDHTGPASYATGGETIGVLNNQTGVSFLGLGVIDFLDIQGASVSGNYSAVAQIQGTGERKTIKLIWVTATNGIPSTTQVTNGTNLSGETIRLMVTGR